MAHGRVAGTHRAEARTVKLAACLGAALLMWASAGCSHLVVLHDPLTAPEHNDLGVIHEVRREPKLAAQEYRRALRLAPHWSAPRVNLGNIAAADRRWGTAAKHYRRALGDSATDCDAMNNLAMALLRKRRALAEARTLAERAVACGGGNDSLYRATLAECRATGR